MVFFTFAAQTTTSASEKAVLASPTGIVGAAGAEAGSALIAPNLAPIAPRVWRVHVHVKVDVKSTC